MAKVSIAENFNRLSRVHEGYRQTDRQTIDGRATAYSEREPEFTFAKNYRYVKVVSFRPSSEMYHGPYVSQWTCVCTVLSVYVHRCCLT